MRKRGLPDSCPVHGSDFKGRALPIWCQEQGHGRGAEPIPKVLSLGPATRRGLAYLLHLCALDDSRCQFWDTDRGFERVVFDLEAEDF